VSHEPQQEQTARHGVKHPPRGSYDITSCQTTYLTTLPLSCCCLAFLLLLSCCFLAAAFLLLLSCCCFPAAFFPAAAFLLLLSCCCFISQSHYTITTSSQRRSEKEEKPAKDRHMATTTEKAIEKLQDEAGLYMKRIEVERQKIDNMDSEIIVYQEKLLDQNSRLGGIHAATSNNRLIQKQIKVLDNRLDKCLTTFNQTVALNKDLRFKIDDFRRERIVFDAIYKKLEQNVR
jgi:hypothetical protein